MATVQVARLLAVIRRNEARAHQRIQYGWRIDPLAVGT